MSKEVILTGIRANNDLTIGNYFGAIMPIIDMAKNRSEEFQINLFVPDLHSFTTPTDLSQLQSAVTNNLRIFVAAGLPLDNPDIHIYRQSYVPAHSELAWILSCFTGFGEMSRMTQFKDKSSKLTDDRVSMGLFNYPILMASDILLYGSSYVPVGEDQTQHLEFTRDIAERMNAMAQKYGHEELFTVPKPVKDQHEFFGKDQGLRIKDLQDPGRKMSKSDEVGKGVIYLNDKPELAAQKIMSATTDSVGIINFDATTQPGITNLLQIQALITGNSQENINKEWSGKTSYGDLKKAVAESISYFLTDLQSKLSQIDNQSVQAKLEFSEATMRNQADATLLKVQKAIGLRAQ
ncbi:MAG: tryptophan--tRNA ligase [bacterium]|nr:tryptophan--tRNA ligase [bacterium]